MQKLSILALVFCSLNGCASIMSSNHNVVSVDNKFGPTFFAITDKNNKLVHQGITPQQVTLSTKNGFIMPATYKVDFYGNGIAADRCDLKAKFNPWTAGNILFGVIGVAGLAVDGTTGKVYRMPKDVTGHVPLNNTVTDTTLGAQLVASSQDIEAQTASYTRPVVTPPPTIPDSSLRHTKLPPPPVIYK